MHFVSVLIGLQWLYGALLSNGVSISFCHNSKWVSSSSFFFVQGGYTMIVTSINDKYGPIKMENSTLYSALCRMWQLLQKIFSSIQRTNYTPLTWIVPCFQLKYWNKYSNIILHLVSAKKKKSESKFQCLNIFLILNLWRYPLCIMTTWGLNDQKT